MVTFIYSPWGIPANYRMMQDIAEKRESMTNTKMEIGEEMHPLGFTDAHQAVKDAINKGHEAYPY